MNIIYLNAPYHQKPYSRCSRSPAVTKSGTVYYPFWLAYAAGLASRETEFNVDLLDAVARRMDRAAVVDYVRQAQADLVVCDTSTPSIYEDLATADAIKSAVPTCHIVMVGTQATAEPEHVFQNEPGVDAVARGEYDQTIIDLAHAINENSDWQNVAGLSFRREDHIVHSPDRGLIDDLDQFPFIAEIYQRHLNLENYFFSAAQFPMVMTITSRGCPHRCRWCLYPQVMHRGKYRTRSSENVAAEFAYIAEQLPMVREVGIEDDLFTGDLQRVHDICHLLIQQNNRLGFWCDTRVDLDYETMRLMKVAGCRLLIAGFESANQAVLDRIGKQTRVEQGIEFVRNAHRAGLLVHGCFVMGNPGETHQTMQATLDYAKKLDPDTAQFFPMMVYPGTRMHQWAKENNYLRTTDYRQWLTEEGLHTSVIDMPGLPGEEVVHFCDYSRRAFYLRKGYILHKLIQSMTNVHEARRNVKAFGRFAKYLMRSA